MTDWSSWKPKESATLCFVRDGERVLMIQKKRGLGAGKFNGVGGRLKPGESPLTGILREAHEELAIALIDPDKRGEPMAL
jgi:8-oxo-dGTP diphosphatase